MIISSKSWGCLVPAAAYTVLLYINQYAKPRRVDLWSYFPLKHPPTNHPTPVSRRVRRTHPRRGGCSSTPRYYMKWRKTSLVSLSFKPYTYMHFLPLLRVESPSFFTLVLGKFPSSPPPTPPPPSSCPTHFWQCGEGVVLYGKQSRPKALRMKKSSYSCCGLRSFSFRPVRKTENYEQIFPHWTHIYHIFMQYHTNHNTNLNK